MRRSELADVPTPTTESGCPHLRGYQPMSPEELRDPHPTYIMARENTPVFYSDVSHTPGVGIWSLTKQEDVLAALGDPETFSSAGQRSAALPPENVRDRMPNYPWAGTVLTLDGEDHQAARRILQAPFLPQNVKKRAEALREIVDRLISKIEPNGVADFPKELAFPYALAAIGEVLGIPEEMFDSLKGWVDSALSLMGNGLTDPDDVSAAIESVAEFHEFIVSTVEDRRNSPREDFISVITNTPHPDGSFDTAEQSTRSVFTLIAAGFETTANTMNLGIWQLLSHREQWDMLVADRSLVPGAVEEMLRYRSVVKRLFRTTTRDVEIRGVIIPKGSLVALLLQSTNRDADKYDDPDTFNILRTRNIHLAFGKGSHFCVGSNLARLEIRVMLEALLDRLPSLRISEKFDPVWKPDFRFDALTHLPLEWDSSS